MEFDSVKEFRYTKFPLCTGNIPRWLKYQNIKNPRGESG